MYDVHYNYIREKFKDAKLLFTDTDSLCYDIKTDDIYKDLYEDKELFDNTDYGEKSPFFFDFNNKVIGKMKDETKGVPISEFIGLKSKMYAYKLNNGKITKKCKGINKNIVENNLKIEDYKKVLFNKGLKTIV